MTDRQPEPPIEATEYEAPQIVDYGTLAEFTAGMVHLTHTMDAAYHNNDGLISIPS